MDTSMVLLITYVTIGVIAVMTVYALLSQHQRVAFSAPSILTSLGIFGTFLGITVGLSAFDPENISGTVPLLFSGIKLAFWTSVAGILGGILVRFRHLFLPVPDPTPADQRVTLADLVQSMRGVEKSLKDDSDRPLLGSLQTLQREQNDQLREITNLQVKAGDRGDAMLNNIERIGEHTKELQYGFGESMASVGERIGADLTRELGSLSDAFSKDSSQLGERLEEALSGSGETLSARLDSQRDAVVAQLAKVTQELRDALIGPDGAAQEIAEKMKLSQTELGSSLASELSRLGNVLTKDNAAAAEHISQALMGSSDKLAAASDDSRNALMEQLAKVTQELRDALIGPEGAAQEIAEKMKLSQTDLGSALAAELSKLGSMLTEDNAAAAERISQALIGSSDKLAAASDDSRNALLEQLAKVSTDLRDALLGPEGATQELATKMQQSQTELANALARVTETLSNTLGENAELLSSKLGESTSVNSERMHELGQAMQALREAMGKDAGAMLKSLGEVQQGTVSLGERLAGVLGENNESLAEAITRLQTTMGGDTAQLIERMEGLREGSDALGEKLADVLGKGNAALTEVMQNNRDVLAAKLVTAVEDLRDALVGPEGASTALSKSVQEGQLQLAQALSRSADDMRNMLINKLAQGDQATSRGLKEMVEAITTLQQAMQGDAANMLQSLADVKAGTEVLGERLGERFAELLADNGQALAGALQSLQSALGNDSAKVLQALGKVNEGTGSLAERLTAVLGDNQQALVESLSSLQSALGSDSTKVLEALAEVTQGSAALGDRLNSSLSQHGNSLKQALENLQSSLSTESAQALSGLAAQLDNKMSEGQQALTGALQALQEAMGEDSGKVLHALAELYEGTDKLGDKVSSAVGASDEALNKALQGVQEGLSKNGQAMLQRMDAIRSGSEKLGDRVTRAMAASDEAIANALQAARDVMAAQVTEGVTQLRDALVGPEGAATELGHRLQQGQVELASALLRTTDSLRQALGDDLAGVVHSVGELSGGLQELADSVAASFGESTSGLSGDVNNLATTVADAVDDLRLAIVGPDGARAGIIDELRSSRESTEKSLDGILTALEENTQRQVDYSPKGLMEVLEELISQFNTRFSGQFWEKLGGFTQSVAELSDWMALYRKQLADMVEQQSKSAKNMDKATRRFDEVASKSEIFIDVSRNMSSLLNGLDSQRVQMEGHLKSFAHIVDETRDNLENIEEQIVNGNENMNKHLKSIAERIEEQVVRVDTAMDEELRKALLTFGQQLSALSEKFVEDYTPLTDRLREVVSIAQRV